MEPSWSPAGGYITFTRQRRNHSSLYHVDLASSQPTRYRLGDVEGPRSPAWSPRASPPLLAFRSTLGVYVYDRRHATPTRLSSISPLTGPVWSNDATRVAYLTNRGTFNSAGELVIAAIHGGRTLRIAHFSPTYLDPIGQPAWRPPTEPR